MAARKGPPVVVDDRWSSCLNCGKTIGKKERYCTPCQRLVDKGVPRDSFGRFMPFELCCNCGKPTIVEELIEVYGRWGARPYCRACAWEVHGVTADEGHVEAS